MEILAGIILLGVLIVFHELGHFLFAKALGVRVLVFSVGFGPKIWGFKKGETEYRLSAIPLGGYVRMFGESLEEELREPEKKISFMHQPIWRKSLIAFAGPLFNFILPIILFFFLLVGAEEVFAPRIVTLAKDGAA
jgi:regulator of sigma E protease